MRINPFNDISNKQVSGIDNKIAGSNYFGHLKKMSVGAGTDAVKMDQSGLWAGANKFANAPFKVDMDGNIYIASSSGKLVIDAINNRIVIYDSSGIPRVLLGFESNGF